MIFKINISCFELSILRLEIVLVHNQCLPLHNFSLKEFVRNKDQNEKKILVLVF